MLNEHEIAKISILAGKIMLESGAETHRVEDTMTRIATSFGLTNVQSFATPTGINFSISYDESARFMRISNRSTDLHKIAEVNDISRKISLGELTLAEALKALKTLEKTDLSFPSWLQILAAAALSSCFLIMFGGTWTDFIPTFLAGGIGFWIMLIVFKYVEIRFMADFIASFVIGAFAILFVYIGFGLEMDQIIIGAVMPLVPGLPITNAVRDLLAGHLVAGVSKGVEALLTAFAIGAGIAVCFGVL